MKVKKKQASELKEWAAALAEQAGRKTKEVLNELIEELKGIVKEPYLSALEEDKKVESAIRILKAKHVSTLRQSGRDFELLILDKTSSHRVTPKAKDKEPYDRADIMGLALCTDEKATTKEQDVRFFNLALFDDDTKLVEGVERETTYTVKVSGEVKGKIWELGAIEGITNFKESEEQMETDIEQALLQLFDLVTIADGEFNLSDPKKRGDLKLVRGDVTFARVQTSDSGYTYGRYVIIDDSLDIEDIKANGGLSIMVDKAQVLYDEGSDLYFLGSLEKDEEFGLGMVNATIIPIIPIPIQQNDDINDIPEEEDDEPIDEDEELSLGDDEEGQEEVEEPEVEDEPEEEDEPKKKPSKSTKKPSKPKPEKKEEEDDDDGGSIDLGED